VTVKVNLGALRQTTWHEFAIRFICGGAITAATGVLAKRFGPGVGGLFLAFPAIFPASATLIENREKRKKERLGMKGTARARNAVALEARGAATGALGLVAFAAVARVLLPTHAAWLALSVATLSWLTVSLSLWKLHKIVRGRVLSR
jgi:hypothetical protein